MPLAMISWGSPGITSIPLSDHFTSASSAILKIKPFTGLSAETVIISSTTLTFKPGSGKSIKRYGCGQSAMRDSTLFVSLSRSLAEMTTVCVIVRFGSKSANSLSEDSSGSGTCIEIISVVWFGSNKTFRVSLCSQPDWRSMNESSRIAELCSSVEFVHQTSTLALTHGKAPKS